jgi:four helix bundle protein
MLRIQPVSYEMVREVGVLAGKIAEWDRDQARQLRRSAASVPLNLGEGSGSRGGTRRARYETALGSARETEANLEVAAAIGYIDGIPQGLRRKLDHIIGVLVRLLY